MKKILFYIKQEPVFIISFLAAVISCFFVPPSLDYIEYIDFRTLALLYALMVVVAGLNKAGIFTAFAHTLCLRAKNIRMIGMLLICLCFFSSMLITNDVALLTFVPFSIIVLNIAGNDNDLLRIVVLETVAANLGSMLTPVGNPQNLYLYSFYNLTFPAFLSITFPVWLLSCFLLLGSSCFLPNTHLPAFPEQKQKVDTKSLIIYLCLFILCLLTVIRILPWPILLLILLLVLLLYDRHTLIKADFFLLLTFVAFFIFAGNLSKIPKLNSLLQAMLSGREYWTALLTSQIISNVPAALLLSNFTDNARSLIMGVDIGGLGTPIASLASLISLKLYSQTKRAKTGRYMLEFIVISLLLLVILSVFQLNIPNLFP